MVTGEATTVVHFNYEKETPGTYRYREVDDDGNTKTVANGAVIGPLYIRKSAMPRKLTNLKIETKKNVTSTQKGAVISTGNAFWAWFYEFGSRHQPARPWFRPAFAASVDQVLAALKDRLGNGIENAFAKLLRK